MFSEPANPGTDTGISTQFGRVGNSHATTPSNAASFAYVSIPSLMPTRQDSVHSSGAESTSRFDVPSQNLSDTIRERDRLRHDLNETKIKLRTLEQNAASFDIQKGVFIEQIKSLQSELRAVKAERDSLKTIVEQQVCAPSSDRKRRKGSCTVADVSLRYLGVATKVLSKLSACCSRETSELCPFSTVPMRRWSGRADIVTDFGIPTSSSTVAPYPGDSLLSSGRYYTPSFKNEVDFLGQIVQAEVQDPAWVDIFASDSEKTACVESITSDRKMRGKVRQLLSDELSARKRKARDTLFEALGFHCLRSRYAAHSDEQVRAKKVDIQEAKKKLLNKLPSGTWDFGHWRESDVTCMCKSGMEDAVQCRVIPFSDGTLQLFRHQIAIRVLHQFMGFDPQQPGSSASVETYVENSIVSLARLDAFIATAVVCLREDGTDTVGGHRQKLYHETFKPYVADAYNQIIGKVGRFVQDWAPQDLDASIISVHGGLPSSSIVHSREATVEVFVPSVNRRFIAVSWNWFREFITVELGAVHDCYIAEYDSAVNDVRLLGSSTSVP